MGIRVSSSGGGIAADSNGRLPYDVTGWAKGLWDSGLVGDPKQVLLRINTSGNMEFSPDGTAWYPSAQGGPGVGGVLTDDPNAFLAHVMSGAATKQFGANGLASPTTLYTVPAGKLALLDTWTFGTASATQTSTLLISGTTIAKSVSSPLGGARSSFPLLAGESVQVTTSTGDGYHVIRVREYLPGSNVFRPVRALNSPAGATTLYTAPNGKSASLMLWDNMFLSNMSAASVAWTMHVVPPGQGASQRYLQQSAGESAGLSRTLNTQLFIPSNHSLIFTPAVAGLSMSALLVES